MLAEMVSLETENPDVYQQFTEGNWTAQLSEHSTYGRMEPDKVIEMTINKTPGGTTGFTMKADSIMRRTLNASYRAELRKCLYTHLNYSPQLYSHKGLTTIRKKDEKYIKLIMDVAQTLFVHPFSYNDLICISNGLVAAKDVKKDLITAEQKGKQAMNDFVDKRLCEEPEFFTPIKKMKLKTFSSLKKTAKSKVKGKVIPIKSHSNMFGQLALIMQTRDIDLRKLFEYPLVSVWANGRATKNQ